MQKLAKIQARAYAVQHGAEGLDAIEKSLFIIAGVIAGAVIVALVVKNVQGATDSAGKKLGDAAKLADEVDFGNTPAA